MLRAIKAELLKIKGSKVPLWTALAILAYAGMAVGGAVAMKYGDLGEFITSAGGAFKIAVEQGLFKPTWHNLLRENPQGVAGGLGLLLFGFVTAYVFGRERKEGTDATLLTAPVQRWTFGVAKMVVVGVWVLALTLLSFTLHTLGFAAVGLSGFSWKLMFESLGEMLLAALILYATLPLVGFVALLGKPGYLKPMIATLLFMMVGNTFIMPPTYAHLVPWSMPFLIEGASFLPVVDGKLEPVSALIVGAVFIVSMALLLWKFSRSNDNL